jgi:hypothetical protein
MTVRICYCARMMGTLRYRNDSPRNGLACRAYVATLRFQYKGTGAQQRENNIDSEHVC